MTARSGTGIRHKARLIHRAVLRWYRINARPLPWRVEGDAYRVLVSEFMLQQTQVSRVMPFFDAWMLRFPTIASLSDATPREVLLAWAGLGYNRRALHLHAAARIVVDEFSGRIPASTEALRRLPGVGPYTAHAIACFAYKARVPVVDVNIRRIFSRIDTRRSAAGDLLPEGAAWSMAEALLPARAYYAWNQALMDLGSMICTAARPKCTVCPLRAYCASAGLSAPRGRGAPATETPRRIFRGRVLRFLGTRAPSYAASITHIGEHLVGDFSAAQMPWIMDVLGSLSKDGLITLRDEASGHEYHPGRRLPSTKSAARIFVELAK